MGGFDVLILFCLYVYFIRIFDVYVTVKVSHPVSLSFLHVVILKSTLLDLKLRLICESAD